MNFATVGTSPIAAEFINAAKKTECYNLLAVYSRDINKAEAFGRKHEAAFYCDSFTNLLTKDLDVVYIASPNALHFEQAEFFLKNGKHVICEKPIVTRKGQFEALYKTANESGVYLFESLRHIHTPGFAQIKEYLDEILPIRNVSLSLNQYSSKYDAFKNGNIQNVFDTKFDGGAKFDIGVYPVSFAAALFGKPLSFYNESMPLHNGVDGAGAYILNYGSFLCSITYSKISDDIVLNQIVGENGGISFNKLTSLNHIELHRGNKSKKDISPIQDADNMCYEAETFARIIENNYVEQYDELVSISGIASELLVNE